MEMVCWTKNELWRIKNITMDSTLRQKQYETLGIGESVFDYGEEILRGLKERFDRIDQLAEYNQLKVLSAFQKNKVSEASAALAALGYSQSEIGLALKGIDMDSLTLEQIIKQALKKMVK